MMLSFDFLFLVRPIFSRKPNWKDPPKDRLLLLVSFQGIAGGCDSDQVFLQIRFFKLSAILLATMGTLIEIDPLDSPSSNLVEEETKTNQFFKLKELKG